MNRLTHKRENGIKRGYWSPNKKQELVDRLAMYEDREDAKDTNVPGKWIPCSERLPENDKKVLCYVESSMRVGDDIVTGSQHDGLWFMQSGVGMQSFSKACTVTAWMPLSGPMKEDGV